VEIFAKDQGIYEINDFYIVINQEKHRVSRFVDDELWIFSWQDLMDDDYQIYLEANDTWGNLTTTEPITVKVRKQYLDLSHSSVNIDKEEIDSTGLDYAIVAIRLYDDYNRPIPDRLVKLSYDKGLIISNFNHTTNQNGVLDFNVSSVKAGPKRLMIEIDKQIVKSFIINVLPGDVSVASFNHGDLIKGSSSAVYYLGADGKRYAFPNQQIYLSWYKDFSKVKQIEDTALSQIPFGGNVTFRPGFSLVKLQTNPKVYAVAQNGELRWVATEDVARDLFGNDWLHSVRDLSDAFFTDYKIGQAINNAIEFNLIGIRAATTTINSDKNLY